MGYRCTVSADGRRLLYGRRGSLHEPLAAELRATDDTGDPADTWHRWTSGLPAVSPDGLWIAAHSGSEFAASGQDSNWRRRACTPWRRSRPVWSPTDSSWPSPLAAADPGASGSLGRTASGPRRSRTRRSASSSDLAAGRPLGLADAGPAELPDSRPLDGARRVPSSKSLGWLAGSIRRFSPRGRSTRVGVGPIRAELLLLSWPGREERFLARRVRPIGWSTDGEWIYAIGPTAGPSSGCRQRTGGTGTIGRFRRPCCQRLRPHARPRRDRLQSYRAEVRRLGNG